MKIRIFSTTLDGEPIPGYGDILEGQDGLEVVERMRIQTPFTARRTTTDYMAEVLAGIEAPIASPLPDRSDAAATEFLSRLAKQGFIEFFLEDNFQKSVTDICSKKTIHRHFNKQEVLLLCADK